MRQQRERLCRKATANIQRASERADEQRNKRVEEKTKKE